MGHSHNGLTHGVATTRTAPLSMKERAMATGRRAQNLLHQMTAFELTRKDVVTSVTRGRPFCRVHAA